MKHYEEQRVSNTRRRSLGASAELADKKLEAIKVMTKEEYDKKNQDK